MSHSKTLLVKRHETMKEFVSKDDFEEWMFAQTDGLVQSGPFEGMKLPHRKSWSDGALAPMLLGTHEEELHGPIEAEIARLSPMRRPHVVNVGCAEGYYAVGLKRRLPHAIVWALDISAEALKATSETAAANGVSVVTNGVIGHAFDAPDLIVMDCEGGEVRYLDPEKAPALLKAHMIVEIHQSPEQQSGHILADVWTKTHKIVCYYEAGRNPNKFTFLKNESSLMRWLAVCENRPCQMAYFYMTPAKEGE